MKTKAIATAAAALLIGTLTASDASAFSGGFGPGFGPGPGFRPAFGPRPWFGPFGPPFRRGYFGPGPYRFRGPPPWVRLRGYWGPPPGPFVTGPFPPPYAGGPYGPAPYRPVQTVAPQRLRAATPSGAGGTAASGAQAPAPPASNGATATARADDTVSTSSAAAGRAPDAVCGAASQDTVTLKGACTQLTLGDKDSTSLCSGTVSLTKTPQGRTNVCFRTSNNAVLGFSGLESGQGRTSATTIDQPVSTVAFQFNEGTDRFEAKGDCIIDNPTQGSATITCSARAATGTYQATFVADAAGSGGKETAR